MATAPEEAKVNGEPSFWAPSCPLPEMAYAPRRPGIRRTTGYELTNQIGEGTYGKVFKAREISTGRTVALKRMLPHHEEEGFPRTETREIKILKSQSHPNMVKLDCVVTSLGSSDMASAIVPGSSSLPAADPPPPAAAAGSAKDQPGQASRSGDIYMVFEYVDYDFAGLLDSGYKFTEEQIKSYVFQLLSALEFLHGRGFAHRDLKCANLLLRNDNVLKLGDFGLARSLTVGEPMTNTVITLWYRPPELLLGAREYGSAVDMWSVGCILLELLTGKPPFPAKTEAEQLTNIFNVIGTPPPNSELRSLPLWGSVFLGEKRPRLAEWLGRARLSPDVRDLLLRLMEAEPRKRVSAREALSMKWFQVEPRIVRDNPTFVEYDGPSATAAATAITAAVGSAIRKSHSSGGGTVKRHKLPLVSENPTFKADVDHHEFTARERRRERTRQQGEKKEGADAAGGEGEPPSGMRAVGLGGSSQGQAGAAWLVAALAAVQRASGVLSMPQGTEAEVRGKLAESERARIGMVAARAALQQQLSAVMSGASSAAQGSVREMLDVVATSIDSLAAGDQGLLQRLPQGGAANVQPAGGGGPPGHWGSGLQGQTVCGEAMMAQQYPRPANGAAGPPGYYTAAAELLPAGYHYPIQPPMAYGAVGPPVHGLVDAAHGYADPSRAAPDGRLMMYPSYPQHPSAGAPEYGRGAGGSNTYGSADSQSYFRPGQRDDGRYNAGYGPAAPAPAGYQYPPGAAVGGPGMGGYDALPPPPQQQQQQQQYLDPYAQQYADPYAQHRIPQSRGPVGREQPQQQQVNQPPFAPQHDPMRYAQPANRYEQPPPLHHQHPHYRSR